MKALLNSKFNLAAFLETAGQGSSLVRFKSRQSLFSQGDPADTVFYLHTGRVKLTATNSDGNEVQVMLISASDFVGEDSIAAVAGRHLANATAITACTALKIDRDTMIRMLSEEHAFSDLFLKSLLTRCMRIQAQLVDHLFSDTEKRLAKVLLLMSELGKQSGPEVLIPPITEEALAEMIGITRPQVSNSMKRFSDLGFLDYNGRISVHRSLLNVVLHD